MSYPNRSHSIDEGPNTLRHLYGMLADYLVNNLEPGPK
jgi:dipeptidyl-peptidase-4